MLIDGSLIANNPAMYAYVTSTLFKDQENVRVVSLGAGTKRAPTINPKKVNALTWIENLQDLLFEVEVTTHAFFTSYISNDYHRFQVLTDLELYNVDGSNINELVKLGNMLVETKGSEFRAIVKDLVDEKYGASTKKNQ